MSDAAGLVLHSAQYVDGALHSVTVVESGGKRVRLVKAAAPPEPGPPLYPDECRPCRWNIDAGGEFCEVVYTNGVRWHQMAVSQVTCAVLYDREEAS